MADIHQIATLVMINVPGEAVEELAVTGVQVGGFERQQPGSREPGCFSFPAKINKP